MIGVIRILIGLGIFKGLSLLFSNDESGLFSKESNCHKEFLCFNENLNVSEYKLKRLKRARKTIQNILRDYFRAHPSIPIPRFCTQGSYVTETIVRNEADVCDFDVGVYFFSKPNVRYETIQNHMKRALDGHTSAGVSLMSKCVRVNYKGHFHIDMPIYYKADQGEFYLGAKGDEWQICDSKHFKDWVVESTKDSPQVIRIVKYFKAWADRYRNNKKIKMPSGLVFTVWAVKFYQSNERDDVAFIYTATKILQYLDETFQSRWRCEMPVAPNDNVLDKLNDAQQTNFYKALEEAIHLGMEALSSGDKGFSQKVWFRIFGKRFTDI